MDTGLPEKAEHFDGYRFPDIRVSAKDMQTAGLIPLEISKAWLLVTGGTGALERFFDGHEIKHNMIHLGMNYAFRFAYGTV
jgi:hypothetical protein